MIGQLRCLVMLLATLAPLGLLAQEIGPSRGTLVLAGGGDSRGPVLDRFVELAGGSNAVIVVVPTAGGAAQYDRSYPSVAMLEATGVRSVKVLHTLDRVVADTEEFIAPLREATGVWFGGGQTRPLHDAYVGTRFHRELEAVLARGGVVGGGSAGSSIHGTYLGRSSMLPGLAFLKRDVVLDAHVLQRNRQFDLSSVVAARPELLGIGIDEGAAIVVTGDSFEVIGSSYVLIYDMTTGVDSGGSFYVLSPGDRYDLKARRGSRPGAAPSEIPRVGPRTPG